MRESTRTGLITILVICVLGLFLTINNAITPDIEVEIINNEPIVISVNGKSTYRPLSETDKLEGNIIFVEK